MTPYEAMSQTKWSKEDLVFLTTNWKKIPTRTIAAEIKRSVEAVKKQARNLNLEPFYTMAKKHSPPPLPRRKPAVDTDDADETEEEKAAWREHVRWAPGDPALWPWRQKKEDGPQPADKAPDLPGNH